jgi:precorrin-3B methylase
MFGRNKNKKPLASKEAREAQDLIIYQRYLDYVNQFNTTEEIFRRQVKRGVIV